MRLINLHNIIKKLADICCIIDKDGNVRAINEPMLKHCRQEEYNVLGKSFADVFHIPDKETFARNVSETYADKADRYFTGFNTAYNTRFDISINYVEDYILLIVRCADLYTTPLPGKENKSGHIGYSIEDSNWIKAIMENLPASVVMLDTRMRIISASDKWLQRHELELIDVLGKSFYDVFPGIPDERRQIHIRCMQGATEKKDNDLLYLDGRTVFNVNWEIRPWRNASGIIGGIIIFSEVIDDSDKKRRMLFRLYRELNLLIEVIDNIITASDEFEMIEHVCKKIVQIGGYQLVWFGYVPDEINDNKFVSPLHKFGPAIHYLDDFMIDLKNELHKNGPVAKAASTFKSVVVNDISHSKIFQPWTNNAQAHNLNSIISIPLKLLNGKVAILNIYSNEKDRFTEEEVKILDRLGTTLAYSMNGLQRSYENKVAHIKQEKLINDLNIQNRNLADFTYVVSHNLRAKVVNLLNATILIEDEDALTGEQKNEMITEVRRITLKLDEVMKDLNSTLLVKEHIVLNTESVNLTGLFAQVKQKLDIVFPSKNYLLETDFSDIDEIRSDRYYLYEIMLQLLQGIIKQNADNLGQHISIKSITFHDKVQLVVTDHVGGGKLAFADNSIFDIYRRLYQHTSQGGIKLFYVNAIIENIGGKLLVQAKDDSKILFIIELPAY